ncbi:MAG: hypothetical protein ACK2U3_03635 [Anaerolineales bacterium]|jgi:tetratricopeptide (TPR) repeat protein
MRMRRPIQNRAFRALKYAKSMLDKGNYKEAAETYEKIADGAEKRGMFKQAPNLYFEAAKARLSASQPDEGFRNIKKGLQILEDTNRFGTLRKAGQISISELKRFNQEEKANELQLWLDKKLADHPQLEETFKPGTAIRRDSNAKLPSNCLNCGASIHPNDVEWVSPNSIECSYCGSVISTIN